MAATQITSASLQARPSSIAGRRSAVQPFKSVSAMLKPRRAAVRPAAALDAFTAALHPVIAALDIDWSDPDVQIGAFGAVAGLGLGIGAPIFYVSRDMRDEERLEELRALNRATKEETGEYLTPVRQSFSPKAASLIFRQLHLALACSALCGMSPVLC